MADNSTIVPNPMSDYATATYAITLYAMERWEYIEYARGNELTTMKVLNPRGLKVIIAETGATATQITNLSIMTTPIPSQGTIATNISMDITQPRGSDLIDKIFATSEICGWRNPFEMHYMLEIRFLGSTEDNQHISMVEVVTIPVMIAGVNTNLSHHATVYNISATYTGSIINDYSYARFPQDATISSGANLGEFFNNMQDKLNEIENTRVDEVNFSKPLFVHRITYPDVFNNDDYSVGDPSSMESTKGNQTLYEYNASENEVSITNNSTIPSVIDNVLKFVRKIQDEVVDGEQFITTYIVDSRITPEEFDPVSGKETIEIHWVITSVTRRKYSKNAATTTEGYRRALDNLRTVKLYDYIHTGMNTEVREADFTINNLYHAKIVQYQNATIQRPSIVSTYQDVVKSELNINRNRTNIDYEGDVAIDDNGNQILYADDIRINAIDYTTYESRMPSNPSDLIMAPTDPQISRTSQMTEDLEHVRNSTLYSYINCELKIKGDPYWILPPVHLGGMPFGALPTPMSLSPRRTRDQSRDNVAIVRFNYPNNEFYDEHNSDNQLQENMFTAIYYITQVTSTFQNGKFEQSLKGYREMQATPQNVQQYLASKGL